MKPEHVILLIAVVLLVIVSLLVKRKVKQNQLELEAHIRHLKDPNGCGDAAERYVKMYWLCVYNINYTLNEAHMDAVESLKRYIALAKKTHDELIVHNSVATFDVIERSKLNIESLESQLRILNENKNDIVPLMSAIKYSFYCTPVIA